MKKRPELPISGPSWMRRAAEESKQDRPPIPPMSDRGAAVLEMFYAVSGELYRHSRIDTIEWEALANVLSDGITARAAAGVAVDATESLDRAVAVLDASQRGARIADAIRSALAALDDLDAADRAAILVALDGRPTPYRGPGDEWK
jgi:hypothetical protein